jgi:hypothetical protein
MTPSVASKLAVCGLLAFSSAQASAGVVLQFDFTGQNGGEASLSPTTTASGVAGGAIVRGPGFVPGGPSFTSNSFGVNPYIGQYNDTDDYHSTVAAEDALGHYVTFTLTPNPGQQLSLSDIVFNVGLQTGPTDGTIYPGLQVSTDGTDFTPVNSVTLSGGSGGVGDPANPSDAAVGDFDLSSVASLQGDASPVTFRLYVLTTDSSNNGYQDAGFGFSSASDPPGGITVDGSVVSAPEPASLAGIVVAGMALITRRRRRS